MSYHKSLSRLMVTRCPFLVDVRKVLISSWLSSPLELPEIAPSWQEIYVLVCAEYKGGPRVEEDEWGVGR